MAYCGRRIVYTDEAVITPANVVQVLRDSLPTHQANRIEIDYLYKYYKGDQPILQRTKEFNEYINNKVLINRANEIVSFKAGYLMGEPVQYTARSKDGSDIDKLSELNDYCYAEGKHARDMELATWFYICGTAYRMVLPDKFDEEDESPFEIYTLDPRNTFVIYHNGLGNKPLAGVTYVKDKNGDITYSIYTKDKYFEISGEKLVKTETHYLGGIPIIEYPANDARLGAFEVVITMLDAINTVSSNQVDGIEQFVQAIMVFKGVDVDREVFEALKEDKAIKIPLDANVEYLAEELNQTQTQLLIDSLYSSVLEICGVPSQGDGSTSDSSNNGAMIVKNGWQQAEARALDSERMFKESEKEFLKIAIKICNTLRGSEFKVSDIDIRFTRRNYENILQKSQVLISMLSNNKIHPRLAFSYCGMFIDPELAYSMSEEYAQEQEKKAEEQFQRQLEASSQGDEDGTDENDKEVSDEV